MIFKLIKINILGLFARSFKKYGRGKKRSAVSMVLIGLLAVYAVGAIMFSIGAMFYSIAVPLFDAGVGWFYFALAGLVVFALCFIGGVFMIQSQIFNARDNELLLSMPVKPSVILAGRLAALLVFEYVYELLILIPVFAVLIISKSLSRIPALGLLLFIGIAIVLPLFAVAIGSLFGWLVALISSRLRRKNIVTLVLSIAFLGAYFWGYTKLMGYMNELMVNGAEVAEAVRRAVFPAYQLGIAIADGNALSFLIFAACAIVPFLIMYALLSASFIKVATAKRGAKKVQYREKGARASGIGAALLKRELRRYWSLPMYILNTSLGAICAFVLAAVMVVRPGLVTGLFDSEVMKFVGVEPAAAIVIVLSALAAFNFVSAPSISLEGKYLWIVKSLPVGARDVLISKAKLHMLVCLTPSVLAGVACMTAIPVGGVLYGIMILVTPASVTLLFALLGVTLNLSFHRFDWINEIQPVKQGMSSMLSMFGGMALILALTLVYILLLNSKLPLDHYILICTAVFAAISAGLYAYLVSAGVKKFEAL